MKGQTIMVIIQDFQVGQYRGYQCSIPSKAVCRKIGPVLWKTGSTDFLKIYQKNAFFFFFLVD